MSGCIDDHGAVEGQEDLYSLWFSAKSVQESIETPVTRFASYNSFPPLSSHRRPSHANPLLRAPSVHVRTPIYFFPFRCCSANSSVSFCSFEIDSLEASTSPLSALICMQKAISNRVPLQASSSSSPSSFYSKYLLVSDIESLRKLLRSLRKPTTTIKTPSNPSNSNHTTYRSLTLTRQLPLPMPLSLLLFIQLIVLMLIDLARYILVAIYHPQHPKSVYHTAKERKIYIYCRGNRLFKTPPSKKRTTKSAEDTRLLRSVSLKAAREVLRWKEREESTVMGRMEAREMGVRNIDLLRRDIVDTSLRENTIVS